MVPRSHIPAFPWRNRPPPAPAQEAGLVASLKPGPRFGQFIGHSHVWAPQPFPGAPGFAYEGLGLVEETPIGPTVANRQFLRVLEGPGLFAELGLPTSGLGGLSTGQIIAQPLLTPADLLSEPLDQPPENWVG